MWHFAHIVGSDCNYKPETAWHLGWKNIFGKDFVEVRLQGCRADVCLDDVILEFQNSSISSQEIISRESAHERNGKKTIWIVNGEPFEDRIELFVGKYQTPFDPNKPMSQIFTRTRVLHFKHPRKYIYWMNRVIIDTGSEMLVVKKKYSEKRYLVDVTPKSKFVRDNFWGFLKTEVVLGRGFI